MAAGAAIVGGVKAAGAVKGFRNSRSAADDQRDIDRANTERMRREGEETIKRTAYDQQMKESTALVAAGGSGFGAKGSKGSYLDGMAELHKSDLAWLKDSVKSGIDISNRETKSRYNSARNTGAANLITGLGGAAMSGVVAKGRYDQTGSWWK